MLLAVAMVFSGCGRVTSGLLPTQVPQVDCLAGRTADTAQVVRVIDGDTIVVDLDGMQETVRYLQVDTPELDARDPAPGQAAADYNRERVAGRTVELLRDEQDRDEFGRLLRFVRTPDGVVNYDLVRLGYAPAFLREPNLLCGEEYQQAMLSALRESLGVWAALPAASRGLGECAGGCLAELPGCRVKGNISRMGERIYHLPGSPDYAAVEIDPGRGERWFCTVEEAVANGWRPARAE